MSLAGTAVEGGEDEMMESMSLWCNDGDTGEGGDVEGNVGVCLRSGLQAAVFLSLRTGVSSHH
jgi:hypothetical protein